MAKYHLLDLGQIKSSFVVFGDLRMKKLLIDSAAQAMVAGTAQAQSSLTVRVQLTLARNARTSVEMIEHFYASQLSPEMNIALLQSRRTL